MLVLSDCFLDAQPQIITIKQQLLLNTRVFKKLRSCNKKQKQNSSSLVVFLFYNRHKIILVDSMTIPRIHRKAICREIKKETTSCTVEQRFLRNLQTLWF